MSQIPTRRSGPSHQQKLCPPAWDTGDKESEKKEDCGNPKLPQARSKLVKRFRCKRVLGFVEKAGDVEGGAVGHGRVSPKLWEQVGFVWRDFRIVWDQGLFFFHFLSF